MPGREADISSRVFVSSGAFGRMCVEDIVATAADEGVRHIELASGTRHRSGAGLDRVLSPAGEAGYAFLVHNYFPVPAESFVLNLASADPANLERSISHVRNAVDLCVSVNSPFYSLHCGFCIDPAPADLGRALKGPVIPVEEATEVFVASVRELADYAAGRGVIGE